MTHHISSLISLSWTCFFTYWAWMALRNKPTARHEHVLSRAAHLTAWALATMLAFTPWLRIGWLRARWVHHGRPEVAAGLLLTWLGLAIAIWARRHLRGNWSSSVTLKSGHELIRTGPYSLVRHPIYTGALLAMFGTALAIGELRGLLAFAILLVSFHRKLRIEERWLTELFGDQYHRYRTEVNALLPWGRAMSAKR